MTVVDNKKNKMRDIAINIIVNAFVLKTDKGGQPYIDHLLRVESNVKKYYWSGITESEIELLSIISLLHDLIEDCPNWTLEHVKAIFNDNLIVSTLNLLTKPEDMDYGVFIDRMVDNKYAVTIKLADLDDNMDIKRLKKLITEKDCERLKKYHAAYLKLYKIFICEH